jgi:hypothetical protein
MVYIRTETLVQRFPNGRAQAFHARARTNVQLGRITRDRACKVLSRLDPPLLVRLLGEITAMWGAFTHYHSRYLGKNFSERNGDRTQSPVA